MADDNKAQTGVARQMLDLAVPAGRFDQEWAKADRAARGAVDLLGVHASPATIGEVNRIPAEHLAEWLPERLASFAALEQASAAVKETWVTAQSLANALLWSADLMTKYSDVTASGIAAIRDGLTVDRSALASAAAECERRHGELIAEFSGSPMLAGWDEPWVWAERLCEHPGLVSTAGSCTLDPHEGPVPWLLEVASRSVTVAYHDPAFRAAAVRWAQGLALRVLGSFAPKQYRLWVLDPNLGEAARVFSDMVRCNAGPVDPYWGSLLVSRSDGPGIAAAVDELAAHATATGGAYLGSTFPTIWDYVSQPQSPSFVFDLVIAVDWGEYPAATRAALQRLAVTGPDRGVTVIGIAAEAVLEETTQVSLDSPTSGSCRVYGAKSGLTAVELGSPTTDQSTQLAGMIADKVGAYTNETLTLTSLLPPPEHWWETDTSPNPAEQPRVGDSRYGVTTPLGLAGSNPFLFTLRDQPAHGIVTGVTGAGKTTVFHALINSLAASYSPDELNLYLVDMKEGVEFEMYAPSATNLGIPHVQVVATSADREFAVAVLEQLLAIIEQRSALFRAAVPNVPGLTAYRNQHPDAVLPRVVAIVDEFQMLFTPADDPVATRAWTAIQQVTRLGRSAGVHLLLGTQSLTGIQGQTVSVREGIYQQMQLRLNLGYRGAGMYSTATTDPGVKIQAASSGDADTMRAFHRHVHDQWNRRWPDTTPRPPFVFSGDRVPLAVNHPDTTTGTGTVQLWLGEPCAVAGPVAANLRADQNRNLAVFGAGGTDDDAAAGILAAAALSFAAQQPGGRVLFTNALPPAHRHHHLPALLDAVLHNTTDRGPTLFTGGDALVGLLGRVAADSEDDEIPTLIVVFGCHYLALTKGDQTAAAWTAVLANGPLQELWTVAHWDGLDAFKSQLGDTIGVFDARVMLANAADKADVLVANREYRSLRSGRAVYWDKDDSRNQVLFVPYHPPATSDALDLWSQRTGVRP